MARQKVIEQGEQKTTRVINLLSHDPSRIFQVHSFFGDTKKALLPHIHPAITST